MAKFKNEMMFTIGDWSDDGHGKTSEFVFRTNVTIEEVRQAYLASCSLTKISFGPKKPGDGIEHTICSEYEDGYISFNALKVLISHGLSCLSEEDYQNDIPFPDECFFTDSYDKNGQYVDVDSFSKLLMWFIKLSLPELEYEVSKTIPSVNGYWDKDLNQMWGYGLFN